jgi:hypothetical protein
LPLQVPIHLARERVILISGGEGSGKSYVTAAEIFARYPLWKLVYIVGPSYGAARKEIDYLYEWLLAIGATRKELYNRPANGKVVLRTIEGHTIETLSAEDGPKAVTGTGESPDLLAMVEAGKQSYDIYLACRGRIARSRGTLILSGTIEASERWYPELVTRWQSGSNIEQARSFILPTWSNTRLYPGGRHDPEILSLQATYPPDQFAERFGAVPVPPHSLVFREFSHVEHVANAPYWTHPVWAKEPVELAIDPGYAGAYAVLALQWEGDRVWVIDEVYSRFRVAEDVIDDCMARPWWGNVTGGVIDVAGRAHVGLTKEEQTHKEIWEKRGRLKNGQGISLRSNRVKIAAGITRHRTFLVNPFDGKPRLIHDPRCKDTLREYGLYKYREIVDGKPVSEEPVDADNHAMKALAYWLYDRYGATDAVIQALRKPKVNAWAFAEG